MRPNHVLNQKVKENRPPFWKKMGVCLIQVFDPGHGLVSNCNLSLHNYFTLNFSDFLFIGLHGKMCNVYCVQCNVGKVCLFDYPE